MLSNTWIPNPGSPIMINRPYIQSKWYIWNIGLELTTIDNDKTDLAEPLEYHFDVNVS